MGALLGRDIPDALEAGWVAVRLGVEQAAIRADAKSRLVEGGDFSMAGLYAQIAQVVCLLYDLIRQGERSALRATCEWPDLSLLRGELKPRLTFIGDPSWITVP